MSVFIHLLFNQHRISEDHLKRFCFLNNIRSKYLTVALVVVALFFTLYDFVIVQNTVSFDDFLLHFKTDLVFLVFSFVFVLYIFFNQVRTHKNIRRHHRFIHGIISLIILSWSVLKSIFLLQNSGGNYNIAVLCILITGLIYVFPSAVQLFQLFFIFGMAIIISLIFNFTLTKIISDIYMLAIISAISYIVSRYLMYLQLKIFFKEKELIKYKERFK